MRFCIDGRFVTRGFGGQERFSYETLAELDKLIAKDEVELVVPLGAETLPIYENIKIVKYGKRSGLLWEQLDFWNYIRKNKGVAIYLCNTWSFLRPDVVTMHDVVMFAMPEIFSNLYGKLSAYYHRVLFKVAAKKARIVLTISEHSRDEIIKYVKVKEEKIRVIECGWQHFARIIPDETVFDRHPELKKGEYYLSASSITPQKNFVWVQKAAEFNKEAVFAIAGKKVGLTVEADDSITNLHFLGRVTDEEMKALMAHCKAFIHPAKYEGFGITPMEAMSVGAPIIISNAACLPEIYQGTAHYIDPENPNMDLEALLKEEVEQAQAVLDRYSWKNNGIGLYKVMQELAKNEAKK